MANAYTSSTGNLAGTAGGAGLVQKAYDRLLDFALRSEPLIRSVADKRPAKLANPGSTIVLQLYADLSEQTTALSESTERDSVQIAAPTSVTITLAEYGNSVLVTRALELFSLADVDPAIANIIAFNMADSIDTVAQNVLRTGTNALYGGTRTSTATLTSSDTFTSALARKTTAKLRANKAIPRKGSLYWAGIHPEVSHDLRAETGVGSWRQPHEYQSNDQIWAGEIGTYEGAFYVESPRLYTDYTGAAKTTSTTTTTASGNVGTYVLAVTSSSGILVSDTVAGTNIPTGAQVTSISGLNVTIDTAIVTQVTSGASVTFTHETKVFNTYFAGQQALAEAVAEEPHVVIGPVVDKLMRHRPLGWYGVLGHAIYRDEALYRVETSSSINY